MIIYYKTEKVQINNRKEKFENKLAKTKKR